MNSTKSRPSFIDKTAIAGVGVTAYTKASRRTVLSQASEACGRAIADAGFDISDVDGVMSFSYSGDSVPAQAVATDLGLPSSSLLLDVSLGGQAPCYLVMLAAAAVESGLARSVVVYRALNGRSGARVGSTPVRSGGTDYRYPFGFIAYPQYIAMWARRFMIETGCTPEHLASVTMSQRVWSSMNPAAMRRSLLSWDEYRATPFVVEPFRVPDCATEADGAAAVLVTSSAAARSGRHTPVVIRAGVYRAVQGVGLDMGDALLWSDMTRNFTSWIAAELWGQAGMQPGDIDVAEIYDCFSSSPLLGLEGLGFVERGEAGAFVAEGNTLPGGKLPLNTNGGLLAEAYLHGMNTVVEAVLQLQHRAGERNVADAESAVVTSGAMMDGSALILSRG